jgi:cold shock CspA family protein
MHGTIKKIVKDKGFGFLLVGGRSKDLFFHKSAVVGGEAEFLRMEEGDKVSIQDVGSSGKGDSAEGVALEAE